MRKVLIAVVVTIAVLVQVPASAQVTGNITVKKRGVDKRISGVRAVAGASGIKLYAKNGASVSIPYAQIEGVTAPKPGNLDQLVTLSRTNPAQAIAGLKGLVRSYKRMTWDQVAGKALIEALVATGKASEAKSVYTQLVALYKKQLDSRVHVAYVDVLVGLGDTNGALKLLTTLGSGGSAAGAAAAAMKTGDLYADQGKYREALMHGYFKIMVQYGGASRTLNRQAGEKAVKILRDNYPDQHTNHLSS